MTVAAKICGVNSPQAMAAALAGGARFVGAVFYPASPRYVTPSQAAELTRECAPRITRVGLFVDPSDELLASVLSEVALDLVQLHGGETPARVAEVRARFSVAVMKAVKIEGDADLDRARAYEGIADRLLFDGKPPSSMTEALPGGNRVSFDWRLLEGRRWACPWMLSGGLDADNVAEAVRTSGSREVDVSSGVEDQPGCKSPALITAFLDAVAAL